MEARKARTSFVQLMVTYVVGCYLWHVGLFLAPLARGLDPLRAYLEFRGQFSPLWFFDILDAVWFLGSPVTVPFMLILPVLLYPFPAWRAPLLSIMGLWLTFICSLVLAFLLVKGIARIRRPRNRGS